jgi:hypothetical protein
MSDEVPHRELDPVSSRAEALLVEARPEPQSVLERMGWFGLGATVVAGGLGLAAAWSVGLLGGWIVASGMDSLGIGITSVGMVLMGERVLRYAWKGERRFFIGTPSD